MFQDTMNHSNHRSERHRGDPDVFSIHDILKSVKNYQERLEAITGGLVEIRDLRH